MAELRHPLTRLGILLVKCPGLGEGGGGRVLGSRSAVERHPVGALHPSHAACEVHRCRPRGRQPVSRVGHVVAACGGKSDAVATGHAEQRRPPHGQRPDRRDQGLCVPAYELDLLGGQSRLVEKRKYRPLGGLRPAHHRDTMICHPHSLPRPTGTSEGDPRKPGAARCPLEAWDDGSQPGDGATETSR